MNNSKSKFEELYNTVMAAASALIILFAWMACAIGYAEYRFIAVSIGLFALSLYLFFHDYTTLSMILYLFYGTSLICFLKMILTGDKLKSKPVATGIFLFVSIFSPLLTVIPSGALCFHYFSYAQELYCENTPEAKEAAEATDHRIRDSIIAGTEQCDVQSPNLPPGLVDFKDFIVPNGIGKKVIRDYLLSNNKPEVFGSGDIEIWGTTTSKTTFTDYSFSNQDLDLVGTSPKEEKIRIGRCFVSHLSGDGITVYDYFPRYVAVGSVLQTKYDNVKERVKAVDEETATAFGMVKPCIVTKTSLMSDPLTPSGEYEMNFYCYGLGKTWSATFKANGEFDTGTYMTEAERVQPTQAKSTVAQASPVSPTVASATTSSQGDK